MSPAKISGSEATVARLFSNDYVFRIPEYQRPYAWETGEARTLLADLVEALDSESNEPYFLGSLVLIKHDEDPDSDVVDGQQRLTTLALLLSVLRRHLPPVNAAALEKQLFQSGDVNLGVQDKPRLELRERDRDFFHNYIQSRTGLDALLSDTPPSAETGAQANLRDNVRALDEELGDLTDGKAEQLVTYLLSRTFLVVVTTPTLESAHRIFSVLNDRGRPLTYTDILKAEFLGMLPTHLRAKYADEWVDAEELVGRQGFEDLFTMYRMIRAKSKAQKTLLAEFREHVMADLTDARPLLDELLGDYATAYKQLLEAEYTASSGADTVNELLTWLLQLDNFDWQPAALYAMRRWGLNTPALTGFLRRLERVAASMFIRRVDVSRRVRRYGELLAAMDGVASPDDLDESVLGLSAREVADTVERLAGNVYESRRTRLYILMRLDAALAGDAGVTFKPKFQTVEHVLPQSPAADSQWIHEFTDDEREFWVNKLANLVLLTRAKNSEAQNFDFGKKKARYFQTKYGVSMFASTTQVLQEVEWTPSVLLRRQEAQLTVLRGVWNLI